MKGVLIIIALAYVNLMLHLIPHLIAGRVHGIHWGEINFGFPTFFRFTHGGTRWAIGPLPFHCSMRPRSAETQVSLGSSPWLDPAARELEERARPAPFARVPRLRRLLWWNPIAVAVFVGGVVLTTQVEGSLGEVVSQLETLLTAVWLPWSTGADAISRGVARLSQLPTALAVRNAVLWLLVPWSAVMALQNLLLVRRPALAATATIVETMMTLAWLIAILCAIFS